jgi:hypothetical protein
MSTAQSAAIPRKTNKWLKRALGCLLAVSATGLLLEIALHALVLGDTQHGTRLRHARLYADRRSEAFYYQLDQHLRREPGELPLELENAQLGWVDPAFDRVSFAHTREADLAGRRPVLLFGDSYARCMCDELNCFEGLMEHSEWAASHRLYNYGVRGYGIDQVAIHATDLTTGSPFAFVQEQFDYLCSDLSRYPVSRAVAASSAVPLVLSPITLRNYDSCGFQPPQWVRDAQSDSGVLDRTYVNAKNLLAYLDERRRYVRLVDGVVSDNLGVRGPFETWSADDVPLRRPEDDAARDVVLLIVNAQTTPDVAWDSFDLPLSLSMILDAATSAQVNRYNLETVELLTRTFEVWTDRTRKWKPPQRFHVIEVSFVDVGNAEERAYLNGLATSLSLGEEAVTRLRRAARAALRDDPGFRRLVERLGRRGQSASSR